MSGRTTALARARRLREVLLDHGVPEVSIELQDGRPAYGDTWNACKPVMVMSHHIASHPSPSSPTPGLALVKAGRSDLPGPLCNGTAGVDLVYRIICLGYANHPGYGGPLVVSGPLGAYRLPQDNARAYAWGTEYEGGYSDSVWDREYTNRRTGKRMTFREFMGRANAGLVEGIWAINGHGKTATSGMDLSGYHGEHKTWAPGRKPDRLNYSTASGRAEITRHANSATTTIAEDDMALDDNLYPGKAKDKTAAQVLRDMDQFIQNSAKRERAAINKIGYARNQLARTNELLRKQPDGATAAEVRQQIDELERSLALPEDAFEVDPVAIARQLAPLLLAKQTSLTQENIEDALTSVFARLVTDDA